MHVGSHHHPQPATVPLQAHSRRGVRGQQGLSAPRHRYPTEAHTDPHKHSHPRDAPTFIRHTLMYTYVLTSTHTPNHKPPHSLHLSASEEAQPAPCSPTDPQCPHCCALVMGPAHLVVQHHHVVRCCAEPRVHGFANAADLLERRGVHVRPSKIQHLNRGTNSLGSQALPYKAQGTYTRQALLCCSDMQPPKPNPAPQCPDPWLWEATMIPDLRSLTPGYLAQLLRAPPLSER